MSTVGLTRAQRRRKLGIECPDRLVWKSWEPGEEHVRTLSIKNVENRAQVIVFTLPEHRTTFLTPFPEPVTLNSGMSYELPVRFHPTEHVELHDSIEVEVKGRGAFTVALDCLTPFARLACTPATFDFGFCAVRSTTTNKTEVVKMANSGTVPLDYYWEVPAPFAISPAHGHLEPGRSQELRVSFCPTEACAALCQAVCKMAELEEVMCTLQLSGVGKYSFIRLTAADTAADGRGNVAGPSSSSFPSRGKETKTKKTGKAARHAVAAATAAAASRFRCPTFHATMDQHNATAALVDFHEVPAGCTATHEFIVENPTPVPAHVTLHHCSPSDEEEQGIVDMSGKQCEGQRAVASGQRATRFAGGAFRVHPAAASIPPAGRQVFTVTFKAANTGSQNQATCELRSAAGNAIYLGLKGTVVGPRVKLSTSFLNYGDVDLAEVLPAPPRPQQHQQRLVRYVTLSNASTAQSCHYQFLATAPGAAFHVEPAIGSVAPGQATRIRITFQPTAPIHYLRRLLLLVQDSAEVLFVDVFGTAFLGDTRPPPLRLTDVDAFFARASAGLADCTPSELEDMAALGGTEHTAALADIFRWQGDEPMQEGLVSMEADGTAVTARRGTGRLTFGAAAAQLMAPITGGQLLSPLHEQQQQQQRSSSTGPFVLDSKVLTFTRAPHKDGGGSGGEDSDAGAAVAQFVTVWNHSGEAAVATWAVPLQSAFTVSPQQLNVPANGSAQFQVMYRPAAASPPSSPHTDSNTAPGLSPAAPFPSEQMQFLECYVTYAQMTSFRYVRSRAAVCPPHCLLLQCRRDGASAAGLPPTRPVGHGVAAGKGGKGRHAAAAAAGASGDMRVSAAEPFVRFPSCYVDGASYQVLSLVNDGDVARMFELSGFAIGEVSEKIHHDVVALEDTDDGEGGARAAPPSAGRDDNTDDDGKVVVVGGAGVDVGATFACYPHTGVLPPHQRVLVLLRFHPTCHARYAAQMRLQVYTSGSRHHQEALTIAMRGETDIPRLELVTSPADLYRIGRDDGDGAGTLPDSSVVTFLPTCVTGEARLPLWLWNPTSLTVEYQLAPSHELLGVVRFEPSAGALQAGGRQAVTACFAPEAAHRYEGSVYLLMRGADTCTAGGASEAAEGPPSARTEYLSSWPVLGEGTHGVVEMEPTEVDLGDATGPEPQTVDITLYNSGFCEVAYEVRSLTCREPVEGRHASRPPTLRSGSGTIPARTHCVVTVTVEPAAAGLAEYLLYVMVAGLGTDISRVASPATMEEAERHPHCRLAIRTTRPTVQVTDVRSLAQLRSHLWRQLSIPALNRQLAAPVQPRDVATDSYSFHQFIEGLTPVTMELAVGPRHATPAVFTVRLENTGDCDTGFSLWLPTESSVTEENWFLEDDALGDIQRILDKRIIEVSPRSGSIAAGGSAILTIVYRFVEMGIHTLPVVLRVADGRRALIVLEGRTVPEDVGCLTTHAASAEYELLPVALGDVEPPMQSVMVLDNPLDKAVTYTVDQQALRQLAEENYGFPILQCVNPTGVLPARSMTELHWYFRPLEAKEYTMSVPILTSTTAADRDGSTSPEQDDEDIPGEGYTFTFVGRGYHPRTTPVAEVRAFTEAAFLPIPSSNPSALSTAGSPHPLLPVLPVALGPEVLPIGDIPYFALFRSCCTLVNRHPTDSYTFAFDTHHAYGDHMLTIEPSRGRLPPNGGSAVCRVSFYAGSTSQLLQWSVPCRLTNETAVERAMATDSDTTPGGAALLDSTRHSTSTDASEYFAVDGKGYRQMRQGGATPGFERSTCTKARLLQLRQSQANGGKKRVPVTTIPPESLGPAALSRQVLAIREEEKAGNGITSADAAVSAAVELLVQARVMPVEEYERLYGRGALQGIYQPLVSMFQDPMAMPPHTGPSPVAPATATVDEASVAKEVMEELVRAVVAHSSVHGAFTEPHTNDAVYYHDIIKANKGRANSSCQAPAQQQGEEQPPRGDKGKVLDGLVSNVVEEVLEELVFQAVLNGVSQAAQ